MDFFIADTHFGHENIVKYCNRPFKDAYHMWGVIQERWNAVVKPNDNVYHLGDFSLHYSKIDKQDALNRLNGNKFLVIGNHDIDRVGHWAKLGVTAYKKRLVHRGLILSHQPEYFPELPNVHGHTHGNTHRGEVSEHGIHVCVSCEAIDYQPVSYDQVMSLIEMMCMEFIKINNTLQRGG